VDDKHCWSLVSNGVFTISSLVDHLRTPFPKVSWHKCVWFPGHIPKCSFITWITIQNRLYTEDRLVLFGTKSISCCSFCSGSESHTHLFFNCPFSTSVWNQILNFVNISWHPRPWSNWIDLMVTIKGKSLKSLIIKLIFTASIYHIWIERNIRKFQNISCPASVVVGKIYSMVRHRLLSLGNLPTGSHSQELLAQWSINYQFLQILGTYPLSPVQSSRTNQLEI
jgi:hypothetical protein